MSDPQSDPAQHAEDGKAYRWLSFGEFPRDQQQTGKSPAYDQSTATFPELNPYETLYAFDNQGRFLGVIKEKA